MEITGQQLLLTGGSGLLGSEIRRLVPNILAPPRQDFDVTDYNQMTKFLQDLKITTIIHAAAFTSPPKVDADPPLAIRANIIGTANLVNLCIEQAIRLVYISTDYVFKGDRGQYSEDDELLPQNRYAWSKLGGESAVHMYSRALIIRTSFCEPIFPYDKAFVDQFTSRDSVTVIAPLIVKLAQQADLFGVVHVGTKRKTVKELAQKLGKTGVGDLKRSDVTFDVPADTSLDLKKLKNILAQE